MTEWIGKYKIVKFIAKGGMGTVYKAIHPTLKRFVIIKKLDLKGKKIFAERFKQEAKIMMSFAHENIINFYDHFMEDECHYIVLEFIDGKPLSTLLEEKKTLSEEMCLYLLIELSKALYYSHSKGVIHKDVKPANIIIAKDGGVKLGDFGIASYEELEDEKDDTYDFENDNDMTQVMSQDNVALGTPNYMAPEQFGANSELDKRVDMYSSGIVFYEMLTGRKNFSGSIYTTSVLDVQNNKYISAIKYYKKISLFSIILLSKMLKINREKRCNEFQLIIKKIKKNLNNNDLIIIKDNLKNILLKKKGIAENSIFAKRKKDVIKVYKYIVVALFFSLIFYAYKVGFYYEHINPYDYSAVNINVKLQKGFKEKNENYLKAFIYQDDKNKVFKLNNINIEFKHNNKIQDKEFFHFYTKKYYLKNGAYRLKIITENELTWRTLYLNPIKGISDKKNYETIDLKIENKQKLPLKINFNVFDEISGKNINNGSKFLINIKDKWKNARDYSFNKLRTGKNYKFLIKKKGYDSKYYHLIVYPNQSLLNLDVFLTPKYGKLFVNTNSFFTKMFLNDSSEYINALVRKKEKIKLKKGKNIELNLFPGEYVLSVKKGKKFFTKKIKINPDKNYKFLLDYNKKTKDVLITNEK